MQIDCLCGHVYVCCEHGCENMDDENADAMANVSLVVTAIYWSVHNCLQYEKCQRRLLER